MPSRWYFLPIQPGNVLIGRSWGSMRRRRWMRPLSGPNTLDSWISATHGDPSGFWLLSLLAGISLPQSFVWGEFASIGWPTRGPSSATTAPARTGARSSEIPCGVLVGRRWPCARLAGQPGRGPVHQRAELERPDAVLSAARSTSRPRPRTPTKEPAAAHLATGTRSSCPGSARDDFSPTSRAPARSVLTTFYATGRVDTSRYTPNVVSASPHPPTQAAIAKDILAFMIASPPWLPCRCSG